jgi:hypothetical protein
VTTRSLFGTVDAIEQASNREENQMTGTGADHGAWLDKLDEKDIY